MVLLTPPPPYYLFSHCCEFPSRGDERVTRSYGFTRYFYLLFVLSEASFKSPLMTSAFDSFRLIIATILVHGDERVIRSCGFKTNMVF